MAEDTVTSRYVKLTKDQDAPVEEIRPGELNQPVEVPQVDGFLFPGTLISSSLSTAGFLCFVDLFCIFFSSSRNIDCRVHAISLFLDRRHEFFLLGNQPRFLFPRFVALSRAFLDKHFLDFH